MMKARRGSWPAATTRKQSPEEEREATLRPLDVLHRSIGNQEMQRILSPLVAPRQEEEDPAPREQEQDAPPLPEDRQDGEIPDQQTQEIAEQARIALEQQHASIVGASAEETDFSQGRSYTITGGTTVLITSHKGRLVASHDGRRGSEVFTHMGKNGERLYIIRAAGRISVAARNRRGNLQEIGYATHEAQEDEEGVRRLGYISIQPAFKGKKIGNLIIAHVAAVAHENEEALIRVGHPDRELNEIFWKPAGFDIDAAKHYYYHAYRRQMGNVPEPTEEDLKETTVTHADGFTANMLDRNRRSGERYWMDAHPDDRTSRKYNCIAHSMGLHGESVEFEAEETRERALAAAEKSYRAHGYVPLIGFADLSGMTDAEINGMIRGKEEGTFVLLYGAMRPTPVGSGMDLRMENRYMILHAARSTADGRWTSKLGTMGPLVTHGLPSNVAGSVNGQPMALYVKAPEVRKASRWSWLKKS